MTYNYEVTAITASERMVSRMIRASNQIVARRKMRRKFKVPIRSVYARMAADQTQGAEAL